MTTTNTLTGQFIDLYNSNKEEITTGSAVILNSFRDEAAVRFTKQGLPGKKSEEYKHTNIESILNNDFIQQFSPKEFNFNIKDIFRCDVPELDTYIVLMINGQYPDTGKPLTELEDGIIAGSFAEAAKRYPDIVEKHFGQCASIEKSPMAALNTMFVRDGLFIYAKKGKALNKPVQIINLLVDNDPLMVYPRNLFVLEESSRVKIIVCDHTLSAQKFLTNSVTEIFVGPNAVCDYSKMQNEHNRSSQIASTYVRQKNGSSLTTNTFSLHGGFIRNNLYVRMDDENCDASVNGLYLADKQQHVDNFTVIDHAGPDCSSAQLYKGLLDDQATAVFNGRIIVREGAQNTNAFQANNNILLTDEAHVYSKPQLEIYADDVKCSHGATVGQIDENALFYLKSRGINHKEAMTMLMYAFADEVISKVKVTPLREKIAQLADKRLRGEFSRCNHCIVRCC
ncbi:MAG: Fe-S cluster assembly protein SufD [Bacteroidetes bacterium]|nr:Fe-S cluster assembly protein SufD [Bacteroidota bacterium]